MPKRPRAQSPPNPSAASDPPYVAPSLDHRLVASLSPDSPSNGTDDTFDTSLADALVSRSEISVARREVAMARLDVSSAKATHAAAEAAVSAAQIALQAARTAEALARTRIPEADNRLDNAQRSFNSLVSPVLFFRLLSIRYLS